MATRQSMTVLRRGESGREHERGSEVEGPRKLGGVALGTVG